MLPRLSSRVWIAVGAVVLLLVAAVVVVRHYHLLDRGHTTALSVEQARERFQRSVASTTTAGPATIEATSTSAAPAATTLPPTSAAPSATLAATAPTRPPAPVLPAPGVYVYETHGGDSVDALGGDHHAYPVTTTLTVTPWTCGVQERWDVAKQRWEEWRRCPEPGGMRQHELTSYDEFFGQGQTDAYTCTGDARPLDAPAGTTWTLPCVEAGATEVQHGVVVGVESMSVGGAPVSTLHVRVTIDNGQPADSQLTDSWYEIGTEILVAQSSVNRTTNPSPVGAVTYHEDYEIHLTSFVPLR